MAHTVHLPGLPEWLRIVGAAVLAGAALVHALHSVQMAGQRRWWHLGHTAMAAAMAAMYLLPHMQFAVLYQAGLVLFAGLAAVTAAAAVRLRSHEGALNPMWTMSALDCLAMTCMLAGPAVRPGWLGHLFAAYLAAASAGWILRVFDRFPVFARPLPAAAGAAGGPAGPALLSAHPGAGSGALARSRMSVALTLAVMAAAMAHMLTAM
ncbi:hypothetical protein GCM10027570_55750 [Streptomonospora sediminis]